MQAINGTGPYLSFDNGRTKVTTTDALLSITLSNGTMLTPANNWTSNTNPIVLPNSWDTLANVQMLVPTHTNSITLNDLIGSPNNYWGDDDGDGQGTNGISATGSLSVSITDNYGQAISRNATLDICRAPYKVVLSSTSGSLTTRYGVPNSSNFASSNATYYINPQEVPKVCYARPNLHFGINNAPNTGYNFAGPANIWRPDKGFLVQSTDPATYNLNFPTTGAGNFYFDLEISGSGPLRWPTVTMGNISATMTPDSSGTNVHVTLTGPKFPGTSLNTKIVKPTSMPLHFELVGYDGSNRAVVKYGFVLKQWFTNLGNSGYTDNSYAVTEFCPNNGYRLPDIKDLTNALDTTGRVFVGATPSADGNHYQRNIGAGFMSEWGDLSGYKGTSMVDNWYYTANSIPTSPTMRRKYMVDSDNGIVGGGMHEARVLCVYP